MSGIPSHPEQKAAPGQGFSGVLSLVLLTILALALSMGVGSVFISPAQEGTILLHKLFHRPLPAQVESTLVSILWNIRMPRALSAFFVGGILAVGGAVMQSLLQNPLASSYTIGVSSGASLGSAIVVLLGVSVPAAGVFLQPAGGFAGALITVFLVILLTERLDHNVRSGTIILIGMVVSLFVNGILTLLTALSSEHEHRLLRWQMGSLAGKRWYHVAIYAICALVSILLLMMHKKELDLLSFGDEQAMAIGVDAPRVKRRLLFIVSLMTGIAVCFAGTIGFVDLIAPHAVRRIFGPSHAVALPMSFLMGGSMLALSDLLARTILAPQDLPVGAVTALFGAPFFLLVFFRQQRGDT